jgi:hypothetical protein
LRGVLFWTASTVLAFTVTAGVFLMLAELGTAPREQSLSADGESREEPSEPLSLDLQRSALESLEEAEGQTLGMTVSNGSDRELTSINVYLILSSEDTSDQEIRYYEAEVQELASGESKRVRFELDLSPPAPDDTSESPRDEKSFNILEARAASSEGVSTVKTAVLAF